MRNTLIEKIIKIAESNKSQTQKHKLIQESLVNEYVLETPMNEDLLELKTEVFRYLGIDEDSTEIKIRLPELVKPKFVFVYFAFKFFRSSKRKYISARHVANLLGYQEPSTCYNGIKQVNNMLAYDKQFIEDMEDLENHLLIKFDF